MGEKSRRRATTHGRVVASGASLALVIAAAFGVGSALGAPGDERSASPSAGSVASEPSASPSAGSVTSEPSASPSAKSVTSEPSASPERSAAPEVSSFGPDEPTPNRTDSSPSPSTTAPRARLGSGADESAPAAVDAAAQAAATGPIAPGNVRLVIHAADSTTGSGTGAVTPAPDGTTIEVRRTAGSGSLTATCQVSDGSGACSVDVPTGTNYRYTARISATPAGYRAIAALGYGSSDSVAATAYEFESGVVGNTTQGTTIHLPTANAATATVTDGNSRRFAAALAVVRDNPPVVSQCGARIALVLDQSSSMNSSSKQTNLKATVGGIIDELAGTPAQIAGYTFATSAGGAHPLAAMNVPADVTSLKAWVNGLNANGYTNWDSGLWQVAGNHYDLVIFVTDGNPTIDRTGATAPSIASTFQFAERGIYSANALKAQGTRVVALGVGVSGTGAVPNLSALSGPTEGADYYAASASGFGDVLHDLVTANCAGKLFLTKQVEPWNGTTADRQPVAGWPFEITPDGESAQTISTPGAAGHTIEIPLSFPSGASSRTVTVREPDLGGYSVLQTGGRNAVCTVGGSGANIASNSDAPNNSGFTVPVGPNQIVTCTMTNKEPKPGASLQVDKQWVINGAAPVADGQQGFGVSANLRLDGAAKSFGAPYSGYAAGGQVAIAETFTSPDARCRLTGSSLEGIDPVAAEAALPRTITLGSGANHYRITNMVTCDARLTLNKVVDNTGGGTKTVADFPLKAARGATSVIAGPDPVAGPSAGIGAFVAAGSYDLSETQQPGYAPSAWACSGGQVSQTGAGTATVKVAAGADVICTLTNTAQRPTLTLVKRVDHAGTSDDAGPGDWHLTAAAAGGRPVIDAAPSRDVPGEPAEAATDTVSLDVGSYQLAESGGPAGYTSLGYVCTGSDAVVTSISLALGQQVTCTVTNRATPPRVTVTKEVFRLGEDRLWHAWDGKPVASGDHVRWVITATNQTAAVPYSGPLWADDVTNVLQGTTGLTLTDASFPADPPGSVSYTFGTASVAAATASGQRLAGGSAIVVTFEASVAPASQLAQHGVTHLGNTVVPGGEATCPSTQPDCTTDNPLSPIVEVAKSVDKLVDGQWQEWNNQVVRPGDTLRWTLSAHNTSTVPYAGPLLSDNLDQVLAGTDLAWQAGSFDRQHPALTDVGLTASTPQPSGNAISVATHPGERLAPGATTSVHFQATVRPASALAAAGLSAIDNVLVPDKGIEQCEAAGTTCQTHNPFTPRVEIAKTVTKQVGEEQQDWNGKSVVPGDRLTWTLTVTNSSPLAAHGTLFSDDLESTLSATDLPRDAASFEIDPAVGLTLSLDGTVLTGRAPEAGLAPGAQVTVRYTGTVKSYADLPQGLDKFANVLVPGEHTECPPDDADGPSCITINLVPPAWTLAKSSDPASGASIQPGEQIRYTLTVRNVGVSPATNLDITDSLADVTPYVAAPPVIDPDDVAIGAAEADATRVHWTIPSLPAGATKTVSYTVTVKAGTWGHQLRNVVTGAGDVPPLECATGAAGQPARVTAATEPCSTGHHVPGLAHLSLVKTLNDPWGGPAEASDWMLSADGGAGLGLPETPGKVEGRAGSFDHDVLPGSYLLGELPASGFPGDPDAYTASEWACQTTEGGEPVELIQGHLTLASGDRVTCRLTNSAVPPRLTLEKRLAGQGPQGQPHYSEATSADWLVSARGPKDLEGPGDLGAAGAIKDAQVPVGTYRLGEAPRPDFDPTGFAAGQWRCTLPSGERNLATDQGGVWSVTVGLGQRVRCVIVNTEEPPRWGLAKLAEPASGSEVTPGQQIRYTVTASYLGGVPYDRTVTDDLSGVLQWADLDVASITPPPTRIGADGHVVWQLADFHEDVTISYNVTVKAGAYGKALRNVVTGGPIPPENCSDASTSTCTTTHNTPPLPRLTLTKTVHAVTSQAATARNWWLAAEPAGGLGEQPGGPGSLRGLGGFDSVSVLPGTYHLTERAASASELPDGLRPVDAAQWRSGLWRCAIDNVRRVGGRTAMILTEGGELSLQVGDVARCDIVNSLKAVDLAIEKSTPTLDADAVLDVPDTFSYRIDITNKELPAPADSQAATGVRVTDRLPAHLKVTELPKVPGWSVQRTGQDADGLGGSLTFTQDEGGSLAVGASQRFEFTVQVAAGAQGDTVNTACVASDQGEADPTDNCDTVTTRTKAIVVDARAICVKDAGRLRYAVTTKNVPAEEANTVTATWRDQDGHVVRVDTLTGDRARSGELLWPGAIVRDDGVSIGWPGWRVIRPGETPQFEDMVLDPNLPSYQWREPMTVEFHVNPSTVIATAYPSATPSCEVTRLPGVSIDKTASVTKAGPGQSFDYTLQVRNTDLGAAHDVVVTDKLPNYLTASGVEYSGAVDGVAARWRSCDITGRDSAGYGGTLTCRLDTVLGYTQAAPPIVLHVSAHPQAVNQQFVNTGEVCWTGERDGCNSATARLDSTGLAATGASFGGWAGGIGGAFLAGIALYLLSRQLRRRQGGAGSEV